MFMAWAVQRRQLCLIVGVHQNILNRIPCDECLSMRLTANKIRHLSQSQEYMQWRRQTDGVATKFKT